MKLIRGKNMMIKPSYHVLEGKQMKQKKMKAADDESTFQKELKKKCLYNQ
jgi:hypothetical protein